MSKKIIVSIIGATGYTGLELIRLMCAHPNIELKYLTSESSSGKKMSEVWPHLKNVCELVLSDMSDESFKGIAAKSDCVFLALPHGEAQKIVPKIIGLTKIIDLSADFRLKDSFLYAVPEIHYQEICEAKNIANPGCFAITMELALWPIKELIKSVSVLGVTGSSGSGKMPQEGTHHPLRNHNVKSYKIGVHQHEAEILKTLGLSPKQLTFVPTSGPFVRGIHMTAFIDLKEPLNEKQVLKLFEKAYADKFFVRLKKEVQVADVVGSNFCDISPHFCNGKLVVQAVIDTLIKGASGTAIQNFNLMFDLEETMGLKNFSPLFP